MADNGSNWYFGGATDPRWNDDDLDQLKRVPGPAFEVVDTGPVITADAPVRTRSHRRAIGITRRSGSDGQYVAHVT